MTPKKQRDHRIKDEIGLISFRAAFPWVKPIALSGAVVEFVLLVLLMVRHFSRFFEAIPLLLLLILLFLGGLIAAALLIWLLVWNAYGTKV